MVGYCAQNLGAFLLLFDFWLLPAELGSRLFQSQYLSREWSSSVKTCWICLPCSLAKILSTSRAAIRRFIDSKIHVSFCKLTYAVVQFFKTRTNDHKPFGNEPYFPPKPLAVRYFPPGSCFPPKTDRAPAPAGTDVRRRRRRRRRWRAGPGQGRQVPSWGATCCDGY